MGNVLDCQQASGRCASLKQHDDSSGSQCPACYIFRCGGWRHYGTLVPSSRDSSIDETLANVYYSIVTYREMKRVLNTVCGEASST